MKRGQAGMEFLMTYGWAILVVLAAIGALAYFGVLDPFDKHSEEDIRNINNFEIKQSNSNLEVLTHCEDKIICYRNKKYLIGSGGMHCFRGEIKLLYKYC